MNKGVPHHLNDGLKTAGDTEFILSEDIIRLTTGQQDQITLRPSVFFAANWAMLASNHPIDTTLVKEAVPLALAVYIGSRLQKYWDNRMDQRVQQTDYKITIPQVLGIGHDNVSSTELGDLIQRSDTILEVIGSEDSIDGFGLAVPIDSAQGEAPNQKAKEVDKSAYVYWSMADRPGTGSLSILENLTDTLVSKLIENGYTFMEIDVTCEDGAADKFEAANLGRIVTSLDHSVSSTDSIVRHFRINIKKGKMPTPRQLEAYQKRRLEEVSRGLLAIKQGFSEADSEHARFKKELHREELLHNKHGS